MRGLALALSLVAAPVAAEQREVLRLTLAEGREVRAELRRPERTLAPLPAVLLFGGFQGTAEILDHIGADTPTLRASFPYPWQPPRRVGWREIPAVLRDFERAVADTTDGIVRLAELLRARPDVDPARITVVGASFGAPFAVMAAQRAAIPGLVVVQGFGQAERVIGRQFAWHVARRHGPVRARLAGWLGWALASAMDLPSIERHARALRRSQQVLMIDAAGDERVPPAAADALWHALRLSGARIERIALPGAHLRGFDDPSLPAILDTALDWMRRRGLLDAPPCAAHQSMNGSSSTA